MIPADPPRRREWSEYHQRPDVYGIEFIHASFVKHRFARHVHEYYVVGFIEDGLQTFSLRASKYATSTRGIIALNPDEPHTGEAATADGFTYKALYPSAHLLQSIAVEITGRQGATPAFRLPVIDDPELAQRVVLLHHSLRQPNMTMAGETNFLQVFAQMILRYADARYVLEKLGREQTATERVRAHLEEHYAENVSLRELATLVAFSPYYLARVFTAAVGIPPHAYLESVRIRHAQRLLALGFAPGEVAARTGFPHQSHFTNRFKRLVGVPPGQYARERKITQDAARRA
jgi:AraC-like DNA-binding protein